MLGKLNKLPSSLDGRPVQVMRDSGATGIIVAEKHANRKRYTGYRICCRIINGKEIVVLKARV